MKKIGILIVIFLVVLYVVLVFFYKYKQAVTPPTDFPQNILPVVTSTTTQVTIQPTSTSSTTTVPFSNIRKSVPEQSVKNIEKVWSTVDLQDKVFATTTNAYIISYFKDFDRIQIHIFEDPSEENRWTAEEELVRILGIPEEDICWLNYSVTRKTWESQFKTEEVGLSFCPGSIDLREKYTPL